MITPEDFQRLSDAIQGPPGNGAGPGEGTYPLSHAVYDVAKALHEMPSLNEEEICDTICEAADRIVAAIEKLTLAVGCIGS